MTWSFWFPNLVLIVAYVLIVIEKIPKVVTALLGASILLLFRNISQPEAFASIDFNVIFLLVGMMILVNILGQTGALNALGIYAARITGGSGVRLMLVFSILTAILSAFLDNVTTVLILGSVTCRIATQLKINPVPLLIAETIASNVGGTATLIGDPPNIMIGSAAGLSFNDFLVHLSPVILIILPVTLLTLVGIYRKQLQFPEETQQAISNLSLDGVITDRPLMLKSLVVIGLVIVGFIFHHAIHVEAGTIALAGASILMLFENRKLIWDDVEWTTIFFFIGLFIIVGAVEKAGTIHLLAEQFVTLTQGNLPLMTHVLLWMSGILSAVIDNIPYAATMIPLVKSLGTSQPGLDLGPLWWALALGSCLGGNGSMVGATANVLVADMAHSAGTPIRFWEFTKIGGLIMIESLIISSLYLWVRYLM
jgi:Na+/H+ antiporter NhaD/arsenite permease-like protein